MKELIKALHTVANHRAFQGANEVMISLAMKLLADEIEKEFKKESEKSSKQFYDALVKTLGSNTHE